MRMSKKSIIRAKCGRCGKYYEYDERERLEANKETWCFRCRKVEPEFPLEGDKK